jgi:uncharacterized protein YoxC
MLILSSFTIVALVINFIVILITLAKLSRQMDSLQKVLKMVEKRITEEDHFIMKITEIVTRVEKGMQAKKGDIDWKG